MTRAMRFAPCPHPGCPELRELCSTHRPAPWGGRTGASRRAALGVTDSTWSKMRRAAFRRDGRCRRCGDTCTEADHLIPTAWRRPPSGFRDHLAALVSLCHECHAEKTRREAALGRAYGSPPPAHVIEAHVDTWLAELGGARAAL